MRWLSLFALLVSAATIAHGGDKFPYTAYVNVDEAYVRSGPGKNFYPTMKLTRGDAVEVYRHDPGGWCAIRPPRRSFSWVPSAELKIDRDGIATVIADQLPARVGSAFGEMRDTTQVRLDRGELVEVLESHMLGEGADRQEWSMIAPPSGEFRWVSQKLLDRTPPEAGDDREERTPRRSTGEIARARRPVDADREDRFDNVRQTAGAEDIRDSARDNSRDNDRDWRGRDSDRSASAPPPRAKPGRSRKNMTPEEAYQADLDEIDLELSVVVAEEPASWRFDDLHRKADAVADRATTAVERGRAREMLNKLARFEEIKRRYDVANNTRKTPGVGGPAINAPGPFASTTTNKAITDPFGPSTPPVAPSGFAGNTLGANSAASAASSAAADTRFDGRGKLTKVVSQRPNAPQYAVVDGSGQVTAFITPGPGVNMEPYVGREVGINGQRGYMPEFKKTHVTALRITLADSPTMVR